jgi:flagellar biosynthesis protein
MLEKNFIKKATALQYDQLNNNAPVVTAKGKGDIANNIIEVAKQNDIPIKKDEDLLNMLSQIELNKEIPVELYKAVSEVFSFIYGITNEKGELITKENIEKTTK